MVQKSYALLEKKYKLPRYGDLDKEFDLCSIEHDEPLTNAIRKKIAEHIEPLLNFIEHLLQPDANILSDVHECKHITEDDKHKLFTIYSKLMTAYRTLFKLELQQNEKEDCNFITTFYPEWLQLKQELQPHVDKLIMSWTTPTDTEEKLSYLG